MDKQKAEYLGDGVYAEFDGYHVILKTGDPLSGFNTIYLEDTVALGVIKYLIWAFDLEV